MRAKDHGEHKAQEEGAPEVPIREVVHFCHARDGNRDRDGQDFAADGAHVAEDGFVDGLVDGVLHRCV